MKGHLRERAAGSWAIVLEQRDAATGKRKRKWHSFKGTKRQAQVECARLISEMKGGSYVERWLWHIEPNGSPRTYERYEQLATSVIDKEAF